MTEPFFPPFRTSRDVPPGAVEVHDENGVFLARVWCLPVASPETPPGASLLASKDDQDSQHG